jgi:hypothetical protein
MSATPSDLQRGSVLVLICPPIAGSSPQVLSTAAALKFGIGEMVLERFSKSQRRVLMTSGLVQMDNSLRLRWEVLMC